MLKTEALKNVPQKSGKARHRKYVVKSLETTFKLRERLACAQVGLIRTSIVMHTPTAVNQRWTIDFVSEQLVN
tara:strand:+ start:4413 stop:4631 length:219 start_codon:yes stop_codon:yes gene_type:complete